MIAGLYAVLWGKDKNLEESSKVESDPRMETEQTKAVQILVDESSDRSCKIDLEEPLLAERNNKS